MPCPITRSVQFGISEKLKSIVLPTVDFEEAPLQDAVNFLNVNHMILILRHTKGMNFILVPEAQRTLQNYYAALRNVPLGEALRYITNLGNVKYKLDQAGHPPRSINRVNRNGGAQNIHGSTKLFPSYRNRQSAPGAGTGGGGASINPTASAVLPFEF